MARKGFEKENVLLGIHDDGDCSVLFVDMVWWWESITERR